jgi:hypothetical protein
MRRTDILSLLMLMAKDGGNGFGQMFADEVSSVPWPCRKVATVNGLDPCGWNGVTTGGVKEGDVVNLICSVVGTVGSMRI